MRSLARLCFVFAALFAAAPASASITFSITYSDPANWSPQAQNSLQAAADIWGSLLEASFAGETIEIVADFQGTTGLAGTSPQYVLIPSGLLAPVAISSHFIGADQSAGQPELYMSFNPNPTASGNPAPWYFGIDGLGGPGNMDFLSVAIHEIAHGLGWTSTLEADGTGVEFPSVGERYTLYDSWVWSTTSNDWLIDLPPSSIANELTQGDLFWGGAEGVAANGGIRPELYAPPGFSRGKSVSHLDSVVFNGSLMEPIRVPGEVVHTVSEVEKGIMKDLFWTFASSQSVIPEPSTFVIYLGLALAVGFCYRNW